MAVGSFSFFISFGFQTYFSLDRKSEGWGAKLPYLIGIDVDGNCTSLGTLVELSILSSLALGTHLYSKEYVSPVTYLGFP